MNVVGGRNVSQGRLMYIHFDGNNVYKINQVKMC